LADQDAPDLPEPFDTLIQANYVPWPAATFRRALVPNGDLLRNPVFGHAKDWHFWLDLSRRTRFAYLREPSVRLRLHEAQATVAQGVKEAGFLESSYNILRHWMLEADPPYIPTATAWEGLKQGMARTLWTAYPGDMPRCVEGLHRFQDLMAALSDRLERQAQTSARTEAFLYEADWNAAAWVEVLLSYLEAFQPGEPVGLVLLQDPASPLPSDTVQEAVLQVVARTGRETFPDVVLVDGPADLLETVRRYHHLTWVPPAGDPWPMEWPTARRFQAARERLTGAGAP
jgi:hypothetical protein